MRIAQDRTNPPNTGGTSRVLPYEYEYEIGNSRKHLTNHQAVLNRKHATRPRAGGFRAGSGVAWPLQ